MSESDSDSLIAIKLDAERRREIDDVKKRMEEFLREQINVTNELKLVVKGQDGLKERFEMGVAKTLKELDHKFDSFMMEWGKKQAEDQHRDKRIDIVEKSAENAHSKYDGINKGLLWVTVVGVILMLMKFLTTWKP
jgi:hypothetical protein